MKTNIAPHSLILAALLGAAGIAPALAHHADTPRIDRSQRDIRDRIEQGIASGRITPQEAHELRRREREIRHLEIAMKRDGVVLPEERRLLRRELDDLNDMVERKLANRRVTEPRVASAPGIDRGQEYIHERIEQGVHSGQLTRWEAERLYERQRQLALQEAAARSDGMLSAQERHRLRTEVAALGDEVERLIENGRHARPSR